MVSAGAHPAPVVAPSGTPAAPPSPAEEGAPVAPAGLAEAMSVYLVHLQVERGLAGNTLGAYRRDLTRYVGYLASVGVGHPGQVREQHVAEFLAAIRTGADGESRLSASSAARSVVAVRGWHRFLLLEGRTGDDPAAAVRPPTPPRRLPRAISVPEVERLLDAAAAPGTLGALRDRALLEVLYGCGARISEAVGLDVDDVLDVSTAAGGPGVGPLPGPDAAAGPDAALTPSVAVTGLVRLLGKGSKQRVVPLGSYARQALDAYLVRARPELAARGRGTPALFLNSRGGRLSRQSAWAALTAAAARADLVDHVSPHTMRHSFATHLLEGGADVRVVQELLGHASVTTTQVYTRVTADTLREVYASSHPRALRR